MAGSILPLGQLCGAGSKADLHGSFYVSARVCRIAVEHSQGQTSLCGGALSVFSVVIIAWWGTRELGCAKLWESWGRGVGVWGGARIGTIEKGALAKGLSA